MFENDGRKRVIIENVQPHIESGAYAIKCVLGDSVAVTADIFSDGHEIVMAALLYRHADEEKWHGTPMHFLNNDKWAGEFTVEKLGTYYYSVMGWIDHFLTWQKDIQKKVAAGQDVKVDIQIGIEFIKKAATRAMAESAETLKNFAQALDDEKDQQAAVTIATSDRLTSLMIKHPDQALANTYDKKLPVDVDRKKAMFSTWYELFPRSCGPDAETHGTFKDCERLLPDLADLGFDVLYLPPIHPIGETNRKGKNNSTQAAPDDPGSPWAIGARTGGHTAVHPQLGTMDDFKDLVERAKELGIEVALDIAFQCSPDHPYVKSHPEWFKWRPDGSVQHAENPPKKYEDILPINFETDNWQELWEELKSVVLFWIDKGVRIFRVDNPHTKPFNFWEWLIKNIKQDHPDVLFLSEAFTRPKVMYRLTKLCFSQSYTYFTWRTTKWEIAQYINELVHTEVRHVFRPNLWPNTPDILPEHLQYGGRPAFMARLVLAATLSSNYGIYGPAFENCVTDALPGKEEYADSEKFEIKQWDREDPNNIRDLIKKVNQIRRDNPEFQTTSNIKFYDTENEYLIYYAKKNKDASIIFLVVVNLDPFHRQSEKINVPIREFGFSEREPYLVHELLSDSKYIWQGERNKVELDPHEMPAAIFRLYRRLRRENDFDYYM